MSLVKNSLFGVCFCALFSVAFFIGAAEAKDVPLTRLDVASFLKVQEAMYPVDKDFRGGGGDSIFRPKQNDLARTGQPAYQMNVQNLQNNHPDFYVRFENVVVGYVDENKQKPFESLDSWASMGDRVMTAFYAANTSKAASAKLKFEGVPPEAMALIQSIPEAKKAMDDAIGAMDTMASVPENDRKVVQSFSKEIVLHMNRVKGKDGYAISD